MKAILPLAANFLLLILPVMAQQSSIVNTKHNLSTSGPGPFKATLESRICIFCHTPHRARTTAPLWNRDDSREVYLAYSSSTFEGNAGQPTGASKLCLSCHDGSIALGKLVSEPAEVEMVPGRRFLNSGPGFLGTNLIDDHPVSFHYASSKGGSGVDYLPENGIHAPVRLDENGDVQCTSCHDAHNNIHGDFLLTDQRHSALCLSCHAQSDWPVSSHATSLATWDGSGTDPWPDTGFHTVADNACASCHRPHGANKAERLLRSPIEERDCLVCHSGHVASKDLNHELGKLSGHDPSLFQGVHDPTENPLTMVRHAECQDCHEPHSVRPGSVSPPGLPGPLTGVSGVDSSGQPVARATFGYEVCFKCHGDNNSGRAFLPRQVEQTNVRFEFDPNNPSYHPVEAPGVNTFVPSLIPPFTTSSVIACTDCHQSDDSPAGGGNGPAGPHGSNYRPLLVDNYSTQEYVNESPSAYALCYRCHSRSSILSDNSFKEHKKHIVKEDAPCSACHDAHGIASSQGNSTNHSHLINFNTSYVLPSKKNGLLEWEDRGLRHGACSLKCHGEDHKWKGY